MSEVLITDIEHKALLHVIKQHQKKQDSLVESISEKIDILNNDIRILSQHVLKLNGNILRIQTEQIHDGKRLDNAEENIKENSGLINQYIGKLAGNPEDRMENFNDK